MNSLDLTATLHPDIAPAAVRAAVPTEGSHTHQGGDLFPAQHAE